MINDGSENYWQIEDEERAEKEEERGKDRCKTSGGSWL